MSNDVFPDQIFGCLPQVLKRFEFHNIVQPAPDPKRSTRIAQAQNPTRHYTLSYDQLFTDNFNPNYSYSELETLKGFFLKARGQFGTFLFRDPDSNFVGPALNLDGSPNLRAQLQVVNDGAGNFYSPIQINIGGQFYEDITDIGPSRVSLYANSLAQVPVTDYTIEGPGLAIPGAAFEGLYIHWVTSPAVPVTAQFDYYFRVRFESDAADFEQFLQGLYTMAGAEGSQSQPLQLMSARDNQ